MSSPNAHSICILQLEWKKLYVSSSDWGWGWSKGISRNDSVSYAESPTKKNWLSNKNCLFSTSSSYSFVSVKALESWQLPIWGEEIQRILFFTSQVTSGNSMHRILFGNSRRLYLIYHRSQWAFESKLPDHQEHHNIPIVMTTRTFRKFFR